MTSGRNSTAGRGIGKAGLLLVLVLAGCAPENPQLMNISSSTEGPDEFAILPSRALEMPADVAQLPPPTPGGLNRADARPLDDAVVALGGTPQARSGTVPAADAALAARAAAYGAPPDIRAVVAAEDLEVRRQNPGRLLERLFNRNTYFRAYDDQALDQHAEIDRWRRAGAATPSAPPRQPDEK
jgi:hypothetical protein